MPTLSFTHPAPLLAPAPVPDSQAVLRMLMSPSVRPREDGLPQLVETHMSWVVLDRRHAMKLKKPVCYPPLFDNSTLAAREADARAELSLNRRLAPGVYQHLLAVQWDGHVMSLVPADDRAPGSATIDWVVCMQRLPADRMVDHLIARGELLPLHVESIAVLLSRFFAAAVPSAIDAGAHLGRFMAEMARHRAMLVPRPELPEAAAVLAGAERTLATLGPALQRRLGQGRVVDGHGDLRPEHVCLLEQPVVIDGLTFNDSLRQLDPFEEIAGFALECERLGAPWAGPLLTERCRERLDDDPGEALMDFYRANAALLRARLAIGHLDDEHPVDPERWCARGHWYLQRAAAALHLPAGQGQEVSNE
jgi:aminoglycoside phosphotransferase family enzyme